MSDFKYHGYTPMTDDEFSEICNEHEPFLNLEHCRAIEQSVLARLKTDAEPVAWAMPNSAITDSNRFMMVRLEVPSDDEYGGAFWIPLYTHPPQDTAERKALMAEIDEIVAHGPSNGWQEVDALLAKLRAYLKGGAK